MKKIVMVLLTVLMTVGMHAGNGTRVKVKLSAGSMFTIHRPHRAPAKELVSLYQEDAVLHVNVVAGLLVTVTIKDEDGNILSQELVAEQESEVVIPMGGTTVEVSYNDVELIGMLY